MLDRLYSLRSITPLLSLAFAALALACSQAARAVDVDAQCAAMYGSTFVPVTGRVTATSPTSARPAKGAINKDPNFGTCVVRATDHNADGAGTFVRNDYSRRQAFNADNTRFIAYAYNGAWHLYDAKTLVRLKTLNGPAGDAEPQWHPTDPRSLYYIPTNGGTSLQKLDTETNTSTVAANFAGRLPWADASRVWTKSEGSASADGRYWCFMAETDGFGIRGVFTYDLQTQTILGTRAMSNRPDHVSMSASGRSCVVSDGDVSGGINAWDRTFTTSRKLHTLGEHSDLALGADGSDYFVFVDYATTGDLVMVNVDTGVRTTLLPTYLEGTATAYHVSGKSFAKPGWVLLSTYANYGGPEKWLHQRIMAVELKANPTLINLAHHRSLYNGYWTEPHATVSRDFSRVLFTSNWGTSSDLDVDAFMIRLPDNLVRRPNPSMSAPLPPNLSSAPATAGQNQTPSAVAPPTGQIDGADDVSESLFHGLLKRLGFARWLASSAMANPAGAAERTLPAKAHEAAKTEGAYAAPRLAVSCRRKGKLCPGSVGQDITMTPSAADSHAVSTEVTATQRFTTVMTHVRSFFARWFEKVKRLVA